MLQQPVGTSHIREVNNISTIWIFPFHEGKELRKEPIMQEPTELGIKVNDVLFLVKVF